DANGAWDVFVRDRTLGTTERLSLTSTGAETHGATRLTTVTDMTPDGRFVVFTSDASDLVPGDANGERDVFVRDRLLGATDRVSVNNREQGGGGPSMLGRISDDGRFILFQGTVLRGGSLIRDRQQGTTKWLGGFASDISANGRLVTVTDPGHTEDLLFL